MATPERSDRSRRSIGAEAPRPQPRRRAVHPEASYDTAELIRRAREGNLDAFDELIVRHESRVLRLAYHMVGNADEAADVAQEVFVRIFKYINKIRDETKFATWLHRLVIHASYDYLRRYRMHETVSLDAESEGELSLHETIADERVSVEHDVIHKDLQQKLLEALGVLTPSERAVFVLRDVNGLEVKEIAEIQEISQVTVRRHLSTGRHKLREVLRGWRMNVPENGPVY